MQDTGTTASIPTRPWGISSLGCGELTLPEICRLATRFEIHDLELRAVADRLDLPAYLDEAYPDAGAVRDLLAAGQVDIREDKVNAVGEFDKIQIDRFCADIGQFNKLTVRVRVSRVVHQLADPQRTDHVANRKRRLIHRAPDVVAI